MADESHLWSRRYERSFEDVFDIQQDIAVSIAETIRSELGIKDATESLMQQRYQVADIRAWEMVRKASELIWSFEPEKAAEVTELLGKAIEIDPGYATAYGQLAKVYAMPWLDGQDQLRARELAIQALELEPTNGDAHWLLATQSIANWDYEAAEERLVGAIAANPKNVSLLYPYTDLLWSMGRLEEALAQAKRVAALEPLGSLSQAWLGRALMAVGDNEAALETYERAITLGPIPGGHFGNMAIAYHLSGRDDEALEAMVRTWPPAEDVMRLGFAQGGWEGMSAAWAADLRYESVFCPAFLFARANAIEQMYECLASNLDQGIRYRGGPTIINSSPSLAPYRHEPRFQEVVRRMNHIRTEAAGIAY